MLYYEHSVVKAMPLPPGSQSLGKGHYIQQIPPNNLLKITPFLNPKIAVHGESSFVT